MSANVSSAPVHTLSKASRDTTYSNGRDDCKVQRQARDALNCGPVDRAGVCIQVAHELALEGGGVGVGSRTMQVARCVQPEQGRARTKMPPAMANGNVGKAEKKLYSLSQWELAVGGAKMSASVAAGMARNARRWHPSCTP